MWGNGFWKEPYRATRISTVANKKFDWKWDYVLLPQTETISILHPNFQQSPSSGTTWSFSYREGPSLPPPPPWPHLSHLGQHLIHLHHDRWHHAKKKSCAWVWSAPNFVITWRITYMDAKGNSAVKWSANACIYYTRVPITPDAAYMECERWLTQFRQTRLSVGLQSVGALASENTPCNQTDSQLCLKAV